LASTGRIEPGDGPVNTTAAPEVGIVSNGDRKTLTVEEAARTLGIGRGLAYESARNGTLGVPVIRVGSRYLVPRAALERLLAGEAGQGV
jgi:excisionase family DNA binding protein